LLAGIKVFGDPLYTVPDSSCLSISFNSPFAGGPNGLLPLDPLLCLEAAKI